MANQHNGTRLNPKQAAYAKSMFGVKSLSELAAELDCTRGVIANQWRTHRKHNNLAPLKRSPPSRLGRGLKKTTRQTKRRVIGQNGLPLPFHAPLVPSYGPPVTFDELDKLPLGESEICMCRHYVGDPAESLFCGRPSAPGRAYCVEHAMLAYRSGRAPLRTKDNEDKIKKQAMEFLEWRARQASEMRSAA